MSLMNGGKCLNFFLDSTVFQKEKDVFSKNRLSQEFLKICRQQSFSIYISSVVLEESRRHYGYIYER